MFENIPQSFKKLIDSTAVIFVLSVSSYLLAYATEVGYLRVFGINYQSAQVQTESFVIAFFLLACVGYGGRIVVRDMRNTKRDFLQSRIGRIGFVHRSVSKIFAPVVAIHICLAAMVTFVFRQPFVFFLGLSFLLIFFTLLAGANTARAPQEKSAYLLLVTTAVLALGIVAATIGGVFGHLETTFKSFEYKDKRYVVIREYKGFIISKALVDGQLANEIRYITPDSLKDISFEVVDLRALQR
jgi:hypothetical protein